jgi:DnaJ-domain-containing protein 1
MTRTPPLESKTHQPSHYDILHVSPTATNEEIKRAYRSLVVHCHPDKASVCNDVSVTSHIAQEVSLIDIDDDTAGSNHNEHLINCIEQLNKESKKQEEQPLHTPEFTNETADENDTATTFHQIQAAYSILRNPIKRQNYDASLQRMREKETWDTLGALEVNLGEMEREECSILYDESKKEMIQTVYFHECRCGHTFEIVEDELIVDEQYVNNRVWQCESCSLAIKIIVDVDIT